MFMIDAYYQAGWIDPYYKSVMVGQFSYHSFITVSDVWWSQAFFSAGNDFTGFPLVDEIEVLRDAKPDNTDDDFDGNHVVVASLERVS